MIKKTGRVIKTYNGYYYIADEQKKVASCKLRGRLKKERFSLVVGDNVIYSMKEDEKEGTVEEILPRTNFLHKPTVANVDQVIMVFSLKTPNYSLTLIDKMLAMAEQTKAEIVLCFTKSDLVTEQEIESLHSLYANIGYKIFVTTENDPSSFHLLKKFLQNKITVFAGPSGVGKSSLLNGVQKNLSLATGELSLKISRGKHTTRFAELLPLDDGGYVVDTPGFSVVEFKNSTAPMVNNLFRDFLPYSASCKFRSCLHNSEPECMIKKALSEQKITRSRYESYKAILEEVQANK